MSLELTWEEQAVGSFFAARESPTREECDRAALAITGASDVVQVAVPGSLSYTVIAVSKSADRRNDQKKIVSFREADSLLDARITRLAQDIHGPLVPIAESHGMLPGSRPPLGVYTMPFLPGVACLDTLSDTPVLDKAQEESGGHVCFARHFARYFARCWTHPQSTDNVTCAQQERDILERLVSLQEGPSSPVPDDMLSRLSLLVPRLFSDAHPQVLHHGDLSKTNILLDEDDFSITGIVDWSLAAVQPFGLELDSLYLMTGCMDLAGWHDYSCRPRLLDAFWAEFWTVTGIEDDGETRREIRDTAELGAKIGAILRYGFQRNNDGSASTTPSTSETMHIMLKAWLGKAGY